MFKWKDRVGAVNQAAYQYIKSRNWVNGNMAELTAEEIEERSRCFEPGQVVKFDERDTLLSVMDTVLGTGSRFKNYFCLDPESIKLRQWTQFKNDVEREIARRDYNKKQLAFLTQMLETNNASSSS
jgi:hypothetical protein